MGLAQDTIEGIDREEHEKELHLCQVCRSFATEKNVQLKNNRIVCNECFEKMESYYNRIRKQLTFFKEETDIDNLEWITIKVESIIPEMKMMKN